MSDTPKFEVIDRRKMKAAEEEQKVERDDVPAVQSTSSVAAPEPEVPSGGPRLVVSEGRNLEEAAEAAPAEPELTEDLDEPQPAELPPPPSAEESREQKAYYDAASQRLEELVRAQNPGIGAQPPMTFLTLVQQFYVSAMLQMGAGGPENQRPRVDILGARSTIDLLGIMAEKTKGNLTEVEDRTLQSALFELRVTFNELARMINMQAMQPPVPPPGKR
jgi:hypothetical protein